MFIAHLGVGLAAKKAAPRASLGILLLASQILDILCGVFMVTGLERMKVSPGITKMTPFEFIYYPWSHGLFMSLVWSAVAAIVAAKVYGEKRTAVVIGLAVFSHWVLDWISHRPDLPLLFGDSTKVGLGLWNSPVGTMLFEFLMFGLGLYLYIRTTRPLDRTGTWALLSMALFFPALFLLNHYGPPPPETIPQRLLALPILIFIVLLPWGNWIDRHRAFRTRA